MAFVLKNLTGTVTAEGGLVTLWVYLPELQQFTRLGLQVFLLDDDELDVVDECSADIPTEGVSDLGLIGGTSIANGGGRPAGSAPL
jgi:hypothetical protein